MRRCFVFSVAALMPLTACNSPHSRLNAPPHGEANETKDSQGTFVYMNDNALLADMTVSDMHFMPHRSQLTSTGVERVSRLASLMQAYGGTVRFNTDSADEALNGKRTEVVREFLRQAGVDTTVTRDLAGGEGMNAAEAILIRAEEGMYKPTQKSSSSSSGGRSGAGALSGGPGGSGGSK